MAKFEQVSSSCQVRKGWDILPKRSWLRRKFHSGIRSGYSQITGETSVVTNPYLREKIFQPIRIPNLLPYVAVVELVDTEEGPDLRTRLEGEYIVSLSGRNNRGHSLRNLMSEERFQKRLAEARKVLKSGQVYFSVNDLLDYRNESHTVIRGIFPFRMNGSETGQVFIVLADKDSSIV